MINYKKNFEGKRVTKQGFGVLGRGFGVVKFLLEAGASVLVTDMKEEKFFESQIADLKKFCEENNLDFSKVTFRFGEHLLEDFENCDFVIQASGVAKDNLYLAHARSKNIPIFQESSLFMQIVNEWNASKKEADKIKLIGITGTRAKTTTTFLVKAILDKYVSSPTPNPSPEEGVAAHVPQVFFGGNVQGVATLEQLRYLKEGDFVVMELDSWVLQGFGEIKVSPHLAIFTTFMPDHMNYYKGDMADYFKDKANIFSFQKREDVFVTTENILEDIKRYLPDFTLQQKLGTVSEVDMVVDAEKYKTKLIGAHNHIPVSLAVRAAQTLGVSEDVIKSAVENFKGVKGRLELISEKDGLKIYNDTTATTGDAAVAALRAVEGVVEGDGKIIFITGGRDKELDMTKYLETIQSMFTKNLFKKIIFLQDETTTGTNRVLQEKEENLEKFDFEFVTKNS
jgi:UDP-N-acetylmuramoylalanine--D-glutamate ligase